MVIISGVPIFRIFTVVSITLFSSRNQYIWIVTSPICFATMTAVWDQGLFFVSYQTLYIHV